MSVYIVTESLCQTFPDTFNSCQYLLSVIGTVKFSVLNLPEHVHWAAVEHTSHHVVPVFDYCLRCCNMSCRHFAPRQVIEILPGTATAQAIEKDVFQQYLRATSTRQCLDAS